MFPRDIAYNQLDSAKIAAARERCTAVRSLSVVSETGSTNADLLSTPLEISEYPRVLLAEEQTQGRGRSGKTWASPSHLNVYMSVAWCWDQPLRELAGISLALGASVCVALRDLLEVPVDVKWPNDLWIADRKVAGILTESARIANAHVLLVAGIGINVNMQPQHGEGIDQAWTSLSQAANKPLDRNKVAACVLDAMLDAYDDFAAHGLAKTIKLWPKLDCFQDRDVELVNAGTTVIGVARGVDDTGRLKVHTANGLIEVDSGEVSLRSRPDGGSS